jgi:16S rRNA (cytidine1402-2'-O)-methyltransferase
VIVIEPPQVSEMDEGDTDGLLRSLSREMSASRAAAEASRLTGLSKAELYQRLLEMKRDGA